MGYDNRTVEVEEEAGGGGRSGSPAFCSLPDGYCFDCKSVVECFMHLPRVGITLTPI